MEACESEFHLRLDSGGSSNVEVTGGLHRVLEQGGLADARFSAQHQHLAETGPGRFEEVIYRPALGGAAGQRWHAGSLSRLDSAVRRDGLWALQRVRHQAPSH